MLYVTNLCSAWEKVVAALRVEVFQRILAQEVLYCKSYSACTALHGALGAVVLFLLL